VDKSSNIQKTGAMVDGWLLNDYINKKYINTLYENI